MNVRYGWGTIGHTSMHHAFAGGFEVGKAPACDPAKRGGRIIQRPDPDKTCGKCRRLVERAEDDRPIEPEFTLDHEVREVPLGLLFVDHGVDPVTGQMLQRPLQPGHPALIPESFEMHRWQRDMPWVSERPGIQECKCAKCQKPVDGQVTRGLYHVTRGQHITIGLRRYIMRFYPAKDIAGYMVPIRHYNFLDSRNEARLNLEADRDRREHARRTILAVQASAGEATASELSAGLAARGLSLAGANRLPAAVEAANQAERLGIDAVLRILDICAVAGHRKPPGILIRAMAAVLTVPGNQALMDDARMSKLIKTDDEIYRQNSYRRMAAVITRSYNHGWVGGGREIATVKQLRDS
jgi:hypothetical protein